MDFNRSAIRVNPQARGAGRGALMLFWHALIRRYRLVFALCLLVPLLFIQGTASAANFAKNFGGDKATDVVHTGIAVDLAGNTYVSGYFSGVTADIGGINLVRIGSQDAFVAKLDSSGNTVWARNFGGSDTSANATSIALDSSGNVLLGGYVENGYLGRTIALVWLGQYCI